MDVVATRRIISLMLTGMLAGCVSWQGPAVPGLAGKEPEAIVEPAPAMKVVFTHEYQAGDSAPVDGGFSRLRFLNALNRALTSEPVLRASSESPAGDVHYVLFLDTSTREYGRTWLLVSGLLTFLIAPAQTTDNIAVSASLYEAATGVEVGTYEGKRQKKTFYWLLLFPALPISLPLAPGPKELYDPALEDVLIQIARDLHDRPLPPAIDPARIEIKRMPSTRRELRVQ